MLAVECLTSNRLLFESSVPRSYLLLLVGNIGVVHVLDVLLVERQVVHRNSSLLLSCSICVHDTLTFNFGDLTRRINSSIRSLRRPSPDLPVGGKRLLIGLRLRLAIC